MTRPQGYKMDLECPYCQHRWVVSDPKESPPMYIEAKCPKCGKEFEHSITYK